jgi:hypothetical protein
VVAQLDVGRRGFSWRLEKATLRGLVGCSHSACSTSLDWACGRADVRESRAVVAVGCDINRVFGAGLRPGILMSALLEFCDMTAEEQGRRGRLASEKCFELVNGPCCGSGSEHLDCASRVDERCGQCFVFYSHDMRGLSADSLREVVCYERMLDTLLVEGALRRTGEQGGFLSE